MARHIGQSGEALAAARAVLAARDRELADADAELAAVVAGAYATATDAIRRLEAVSGEIEAAVAQHSSAAPVEGREFARLLLDKHRQLIDIVTGAKADVDVKVAALQRLSDRYQAS